MLGVVVDVGLSVTVVVVSMLEVVVGLSVIVVVKYMFFLQSVGSILIELIGILFTVS